MKLNLALGRDDSFLAKAKIGKRIKIGKKEYVVVEATVLDKLKSVRRLPQVVLPKDAALIAAYTGLAPGWKVLDVGTGSAFLAIFLANLVYPGKVLSYEKRKDFAEHAREEIKRLGIDNLRIVNKDIFRCRVRGKFDLITLDLKGAEIAVRRLHQNLKLGRFFAIYSPHVEQVKAVRRVLEELEYVEIRTVENIVREWKVTEDYTHPHPSGILHTGFITIARKYGD